MSDADVASVQQALALDGLTPKAAWVHRVLADCPAPPHATQARQVYVREQLLSSDFCESSEPVLLSSLQQQQQQQQRENQLLQGQPQKPQAPVVLQVERVADAAVSAYSTLTQIEAEKSRNRSDRQDYQNSIASILQLQNQEEEAAQASGQTQRGDGAPGARGSGRPRTGPRSGPGTMLTFVLTDGHASIKATALRPLGPDFHDRLPRGAKLRLCPPWTLAAGVLLLDPGGPADRRPQLLRHGQSLETPAQVVDRLIQTLRAQLGVTLRPEDQLQRSKDAAAGSAGSDEHAARSAVANRPTPPMLKNLPTLGPVAAPTLQATAGSSMGTNGTKGSMGTMDSMVTMSTIPRAAPSRALPPSLAAASAAPRRGDAGARAPDDLLDDAVFDDLDDAVLDAAFGRWEDHLDPAPASPAAKVAITAMSAAAATTTTVKTTTRRAPRAAPTAAIGRAAVKPAAPVKEEVIDLQDDDDLHLLLNDDDDDDFVLPPKSATVSSTTVVATVKRPRLLPPPSASAAIAAPPPPPPPTTPPLPPPPATAVPADAPIVDAWSDTDLLHFEPSFLDDEVPDSALVAAAEAEAEAEAEAAAEAAMAAEAAQWAGTVQGLTLHVAQSVVFAGRPLAASTVSTASTIPQPPQPQPTASPCPSQATSSESSSRLGVPRLIDPAACYELEGAVTWRDKMAQHRTQGFSLRVVLTDRTGATAPLRLGHRVLAARLGMGFSAFQDARRRSGGLAAIKAALLRLQVALDAPVTRMRVLLPPSMTPATLAACLATAPDDPDLMPPLLEVVAWPLPE